MVIGEQGENFPAEIMQWLRVKVLPVFVKKMIEGDISHDASIATKIRVKLLLQFTQLLVVVGKGVDLAVQ